MYHQLIEHAKEARKKAYAPYSKFLVGAALLTKSGKIVTGCNVENASYGLTACAEQTAVFKAISEGEREFEAMAIVLDTGDKIGAPCGACRQVIGEFAKNLPIIAANLRGEYKVMTLGELLPIHFGPEWF